MQPIDFPEANRTFTKPASMTDEECQPLRVCDTGAELQSVWQPDEGERAALAAGAPVVLSIVGRGHPPVWLEVRAPAVDAQASCFAREGVSDVVCSPENRRRIKACWEACAGLPTDALEQGKLGALVYAVQLWATGDSLGEQRTREALRDLGLGWSASRDQVSGR